MYSPAVADLAPSSMPYRLRPLSHRTQLMARGPGWRLAEGEAGSWRLMLRPSEDPVLTWAHMLRTLRSIGDSHGLRPLIVDLRGAPRLAGSAAEAASYLFAEFENRGLRMAIIVGPDLVHAARLCRLLGANAQTHGRCFLTEGEAVEWARRAAPPVAPPLRVPGRAPQIRAPRVA